MRLSTQLLWMAWIATTLSLLCSCIPLEKSMDVALSGTSIHSSTVIEPADEEEDEDGDAEGDITTEEPLFTDFDDSEDLDALAKGILGRGDDKESVVPCFGTWWPSTGGYVYYYEDYGTGGSVPNGGGTESDGDYGDYNRRRRGRRSRRRRRMRRNRTRRARTSNRSAKKKA